MAPRFSIITPVHETPVDVLRETIASVRAQTLDDWEWCLADDGSRDPRTAAVLDELEGDPRVRVCRRAEQGGIVDATNDALAMARGEFVALLDHDDLLHPEALARVDAAIRAHPDVDYVYTDEDKVDASGGHYDVFLKPDWSPERMRCQMYTGHLSVFRRDLVMALGGMRAGFDGSQDYDLVLRVVEHARRVEHVAEILYHWRSVPGSTAAEPEAKPYAYEAGRRAIEDHLERIGAHATVVLGDALGIYCLVPRLRTEPTVSIVIPTAGTRRHLRGVETSLVVNCVRSIMERSTYRDLEIVCVCDRTVDYAARSELLDLGGPNLRIVDFDRPFNFSEKINLGAIHATGDVLVLLNDDTEVVSPDWIETMLVHALDPEVGAVGAKLLLEDGRIQHAGVVFVSSEPSHCYLGFSPRSRGYFQNLHIAVNYLAVTGACLMVRREPFEEVGGLPLHLPINFNDIDFCLKLRACGYRTVWTPHAVLSHYESSSRPRVVHEHEITAFKVRWRHQTARDPYYGDAFVPSTTDFVPALRSADGRLLSA